MTVILTFIAALTWVAVIILLSAVFYLMGELKKFKTSKNVVDFYEREFYPLSNFSSFSLKWKGLRFDTSEAVYHWEKFKSTAPKVAKAVRLADSAHEAFKIAQQHKGQRRFDWDDVKVDIMRQIIRAKVEQHEYARRKLLETGDKPLIEGSWRDDYWGIGPDGDGQNILGKLWMELRSELRGKA